MTLVDILSRARTSFGKVIPYDLEDVVVFDFTQNNMELRAIDISNPIEFSRYIESMFEKDSCRTGIGRYDEDRTIYSHSSLFESESRTIHLGIDLWVPERTEVSCPIDGFVHSFQNNEGVGDYGPTIILEHIINGVRFFTLYGHLSLDSISGLNEGKMFKKGDVIGHIGSHLVNGSWPSHLHFQIIADMLGKKGDFPGVAANSQRSRYLDICPDPNLILNIRKLIKR